MRLAVGIPTCERPYTLCACLAALFAQERAPEYLFVVDQSSVSIPVPPELALMLRAWAFRQTDVYYVPCTSRRGIWAARKQIIRVAAEVGADALLFLDDDVLLLAGACQALEDALSGGASFVMGTYVSSDLAKRGWEWPSELCRQEPGPNYHWYDSSLLPFAVRAVDFATTIAMVGVEWIVRAYDDIEAACGEDMLTVEGAFVPSDDRAVGVWLAMRNREGLMAPGCRGVHMAPDKGEDMRSGMRLDWLNRRAEGALGRRDHDQK